MENKVAVYENKLKTMKERLVALDAKMQKHEKNPEMVAKLKAKFVAALEVMKRCEEKLAKAKEEQNK